MKNIGILTSGGDAPGMNAAIRAIVRTNVHHNIQSFGILEGYDGLINGNISPLQSIDVTNIVQRGGTILKSARSAEFRTIEGRKKAYQNILTHKLDGLVVIGGDGTFTGAHTFMQEFNFPIVGIPGTIDNDLVGSDYTIGYDTALNTVIDAVDKIKDTASSHNRLFIIEVMGKDAGFIALNSGIGIGADAVLIPETPTLMDQLISKLTNQKKHKSGMIILVAEGDDAGGAYVVAKKIKEACPNYDSRLTILGHIQRGGAPSALDRLIASRMGNAAVNALRENKSNTMIGIVNKEITFTPFQNAIKEHGKLNIKLLQLVEILSY